ncbi:MAG: hypothetical protein MJY62_05925 [Bacteroidales bacterium]|nr:hypothetical protein [Bacteroidales bacterium]
MSRTSFKETFRKYWDALVEGELFFQLKVDRALPSILAVFIGMMFLIYVRYITDRSLANLEKAKAEMLSAKLTCETKECEYFGMIRETRIKELAGRHGIRIGTPEAPAKLIK